MIEPELQIFSTSNFNVNVSFLQVLDVRRQHIIGVGFQNSLRTEILIFLKLPLEINLMDLMGSIKNINPGENGCTKQLNYNLGIGGLYSYSLKHTIFFYAKFFRV